MKTVWKNLWAKLPQLPRRWRIVRNLAAVLLLSALCLRLWGWPSLTPYGAFRRLEGEYLLTPSELVLRTGSGRHPAFLTEGENWVSVGRASRMSSYDDFRYKYDVRLHHVLPKAGLIVVALSAAAEDSALVVAVKGVPEEAVSGELEVEMNKDGIRSAGPYYGQMKSRETFTARAKKEENGWFFFYLERHPLEDHCLLEALLANLLFWEAVPEFPYRLTLLDEAGNEVERVEGNLPPDQRIQSWR